MIPSFDELDVTVMTIITYFKGDIDLCAVCDLFEYVLDAVPVLKNCNRKKIEFETHPIPGSIINLSYGGTHRGFRHSKNIKFFKNSVSIIISIKDKNLSIKLSEGKIHITGTKKEGHAQECSDYIIKKILDIQENLDYIQSKPAETLYTVKNLLDICKGAPVDEKAEDFYMLPEETIREKMEGNMIDQKIANFYLRYYKYKTEFPTLSIYQQFIMKRINSTSFIGTKDLEVIYIRKVMNNYNYDVGFDVKRNELTKCVQILNGDFRVNYDSSLNHTVTVFLPFDPSLKALPEDVQILEDERKARRKKEEDLKKGYRKPRKNTIKKKKEKKIPQHNFLVYKTGQITFSTNGNYKSMKDAYDRFNTLMEEIKDIIIQPNENRKKKIHVKKAPKNLIKV